MLKLDIGNLNVKVGILEIVKFQVLYWNFELVNVGYCTMECCSWLMEFLMLKLEVGMFNVKVGYLNFV